MKKLLFVPLALALLLTGCAGRGDEAPEETAAAKDQAERLWQAVDGLGEPDRTLFLRHYYYGEKLSEAVRSLGLSTGAARIRLSRGRKKLREILTKGGEGL